MAEVEPEKQREFAIQVVRKLRDRSFEAYWAGGCVRDQLLARAPQDYDVATSAKPDEIRALFGLRRTVAVGAAFGVITVLGPTGAGQIEVATFREDSAYSDGRHPDSVRFGTPEGDALRRDFTINGMFYDPLEDRVYDFVGGQEDLYRGIVRAIGDPAARFSEDKLRLLRAVRFAAAFDFSLNLATRDALEALAGQIAVVGAERIAAEMRRMLVHPNRSAAVALLREVGLLEVILPELAIANAAGQLTATGRAADEAWLVTLEVLQVLANPSFPLALVALVHAFVDAPTGEAIARRWKLSNQETRRIRWMIENQLGIIHARQSPWPKLQRLLVSPGIHELIALEEAMARAAGRETADLEHCRAMLELPRDELDPTPLITGDDLIALGVKRGPHYQRLLDAVRDAQLEKQIHSKSEALALVVRLLTDLA